MIRIAAAITFGLGATLLRYSDWCDAAAASAPTAPLLRIETGRHTAFIHALVLDETSGRMYSASEDKTVRVWRIADGRLLDTFRVPAGQGAEGQLYALALSPDRSVLAVAGWTCWDRAGSSCIYLLSAETGTVVRRISGLPDAVTSLKFSADGLHLAVGLMGAQGLRVVRVSDYAVVAEDRDYRDKLLELDFGPRTGLIATGLDGFVRVYDARFNLAGRVAQGLAGHQPFGVRCSPDGRFIAVGFNDVARVSVLDSTTLRVLATLSAPQNTGLRNLTRVAWAANSAAIYAAGESDASGAGAGILLRWRLNGAAAPDPIRVAAGRIGDIVATRDGAVLFGAEDPALGMIDAAGQRRYLLGSGVPDLHAAASSLRLSNDCTQVQMALTRNFGAPHLFSASGLTLTRQMPAANALDAPRISAPGWRIGPLSAPTGFLINDRPLALDPYELPHSYALSPDNALLVVGTEWAIRAFDARGEPRWSVRTAAVVRAVNVCGSGRFAVALLADGTLNWHTLSGGVLVLSAFLHADGESWAAWTPDGQYASSPYGDTFVGWQIDRGLDTAPDFFRAVQFERELYRPDVIAARLQSPSLNLHAVPDDAGRRLLAVAPPRLTVMPLQSSNPSMRRVRLIAQSTGLPMRDVSVYVNDVPVTPARERVVHSSEAGRLVRDFDVPLASPDNDLRIEVFNGRSLGVVEKYVAGPPTPMHAAQTGDLYVLAVGANRFPGLRPDLTLAYAARDAEEFSSAMRAAGSLQYRNVHVVTLSDSDNPALRSSVLSALGSLAKARGNDTVVVFLASHGVSDAAGNYYFVPTDVRQHDIDALLDGKPLAPESSLIGGWMFFDALRAVAGRRLLIVDTCQARNISGRFQSYSLVKRSASSRIAFILASKGDEESQEYPQARHGLFTYGLLNGLGGSADADRNGSTTVAEWFAYAGGVVERFRDRRIGAQTPQLIAPPALQALVISVAP